MAADPPISRGLQNDFSASKQRGLWAQAWSRLVRNRLSFYSLILLTVIIIVAVGADVVPFISRYDPLIPDFGARDLGPTSQHWLGTDGLGRDLWARLWQGTLFSLKVGIGAELLVLTIGITVGMLAALGGKVTDAVLMWITDMTFAFPALLAIILARQVLFNRDWPIIGSGDPQIPGLPNVLLVTILAISFVSWVTVARLVRGQMLSIREQDYVMAARAMGASPWRVVRAHMLPNTLGAIIVAATFGVPTRIFAEATLGFIGLGVPPPAASVGSLINDGLSRIRVNSWEIFWPLAIVAVLMLAFTFVGDGLRDALDPRSRK
jgi:oligopeptide transport system permease protein